MSLIAEEGHDWLNKMGLEIKMENNIITQTFEIHVNNVIKMNSSNTVNINLKIMKQHFIVISLNSLLLVHVYVLHNVLFI